MISIVIVNWNSGAQVFDAISSIGANHSGLVDKVVVVDNNSTDGSIAVIENCAAQLPFGLQIIRNEENRGFGAACNQGGIVCTSEFLLFFNPDAQLFVDSLLVPINYMRERKNSHVGICGVQLVDGAGHVSRSCARFPSLLMFCAEAFGINRFRWAGSWGHHMTDWNHATAQEVDHVIGAFYLIRRTLFESLGGFDERFFVYLEDLDLSLRARQAGWRSVYLATARAFHAGGGTSQQVKAARLFYSLRSRLLYGFKHFSRLRAWALVGVTLLVEPISRLVFSAIRGGREDVLNTLRAYGMLWRALPSVLRGRPR